MHRYWKDAYPNDFIGKKSTNKFDSESIFKSLELVDAQITKLNKYCEKNNYYLWIISSMGQKGIDRGEYIPETILTNFDYLIKSLKLKEENYKLLPAMQPDICIKCKNLNSLNILKSTIEKLRDLNKEKVIIERYEPNSLYINLSLSTTYNLSKTKKVCFKNKIYDLERFGLEIIERDQGTAYHSRDGIFISNKKIKQLHNIKGKDYIDTRMISKMILNLFNTEIPKYMNQ